MSHEDRAALMGLVGGILLGLAGGCNYGAHWQALQHCEVIYGKDAEYVRDDHWRIVCVAVTKRAVTEGSR